MEVATDETFNPIKQDVKNGMLRNYTWGDMLFNYGLLPQTWYRLNNVSVVLSFVITPVFLFDFSIQGGS